MTFNLHEAAQEKIILVAHRGAFGGNIPCNVIPAYETALKQGADMIEIDVEMTGDGTLVIFHPGMEPHHLGSDRRIPAMTDAEVATLRYVNYDRTPTQFGVETLDDVLETFKGRCYINVDKFWGHPQEIYAAIKRHDMVDQMLVKSAPSEAVFSVLTEIAPELPYMPIVQTTHPLHERLLKSGLNYVGAEVIFRTENDEVVTPSFIEKMHRDGRLVWVNSIIYNYKDQLSAGHSDDTALCGDPEAGWGWLARRGFDIIQTDWPLMVARYLQDAHLLYKS